VPYVPNFIPVLLDFIQQTQPSASFTSGASSLGQT
jgi:hypothetical protein